MEDAQHTMMLYQLVRNEWETGIASPDAAIRQQEEIDLDQEDYLSDKYWVPQWGQLVMILQ